MKLYVFVHGWLSPQQRGIQAAHAIVELVLKGDPRVMDWAKNHKTIVVLNGRTSMNLHEIRLAALMSDWPTDSFFEDQKSLENALTAVAILPDLEEMGRFLENPVLEYCPKMEIWKQINDCPLA